MTRTPLGALLRRLRLTADVTQGEVAIALGLSTPTITRWETGYSRPSRELLTRALDVLQAPAESRDAALAALRCPTCGRAT